MSVPEAKTAESRHVLRFIVVGVTVLTILLVAYLATGGLVRPVVGLLLIVALAVFNLRLWRRPR